MQVEFPFVMEKAYVIDFISRPFAEVALIGDINEITEWFFVDSGADVSLISRRLGELLGFKLKEGEEIKQLSGISTGTVPYILRTIKMRIGEKEFDVRIAWSLVEEVPLVLGRLDVFNKFDILFKERENKVIFSD
ncbi:MAG: retropepsin-like domain-containing protein [Candidatus Aenigmarchaeota archaeon]|nr:retropepsin-like domain-containing protein [Candidatus Aenigmarchaeota archaeon]